MPYTKCKNCVFLFEEIPAAFECRRKSPHLVYQDYEDALGNFFPATDLGRGCGDGEAKDPIPTEPELELEWKRGFSEGLAKGRREAKKAT